jgi:DNA-binding transcriptional LysR family regulator
LDIRTLACFVVVAEDLHFRRAAERLNRTQPALSQRIRNLEPEVSTSPLKRDRRRVTLLQRWRVRSRDYGWPAMCAPDHA